MLDEYIENVKFCQNINNAPYDVENDCYQIVYDDGTTDYIDSEYDGHKIRKTHIVSICNINCSTAIVFGHFEINDAEVVYASDHEKIDAENIIEVDSWDYRQTQ